MDVIWHKVWFDLWQRKGRTVLAILSIAAGVFAVGMIVGMGDQLLSTMDRSHLDTNPSHFTINLSRPVAQGTAQALEDIPGVDGVESVNSVPVRYKTAPDANWEAGLVVMRPDYTDQTYDYLSLKDGRWPKETNIGIERLTSAYFDLDIGDRVILELEGTDRAFPITGKIRHP